MDDEKDLNDDCLWDFATRDVKPIKRDAPGIKPQKRVLPVSKPAECADAPKLPVFEPRSDIQSAVSNAGMDRKTEDRLRKGQISIEARLDLHGYRQIEARTALNAFIEQSQSRGLRCVLVITGKGAGAQGMRDPLESGQGVLRRVVPQWLTEPPLSSIALRVFEARPKDGGAGAFYVYLRRRR